MSEANTRSFPGRICTTNMYQVCRQERMKNVVPFHGYRTWQLEPGALRQYVSAHATAAAALELRRQLVTTHVPGTPLHGTRVEQDVCYYRVQVVL